MVRRRETRILRRAQHQNRTETVTGAKKQIRLSATRSYTVKLTVVGTRRPVVATQPNHAFVPSLPWHVDAAQRLARRVLARHRALVPAARCELIISR